MEGSHVTDDVYSLSLNPAVAGEGFRSGAGEPVRVADLGQAPHRRIAFPPGAGHTEPPPGVTPSMDFVQDSPIPYGDHLPAVAPGASTSPPEVTSAEPHMSRGHAGAVPPAVAAAPAGSSAGGRLSPHGVCWVATHGGAGATTMAAVIGGVDVGCRWPAPTRSEPARVILVARTHAAGIRAASRALKAIQEGRHPAGMALGGLVLIADAPGHLPRLLARRVKVLRSAVPVWRLPWVQDWRLGRQTDRLPSQVTRLRALIQEQALAGVRAQ
jgi:hypothetical protein